ncbi:hypothetical protein ZWY2020_028204 [Hordeum vulgare]|nr:hypothetical protein ZWY2020_028204 [Hordeum vulgare]
MKFTFKLLQKPDLPWVNWFFQHYSLGFTLQPNNPSYLWTIVNQQLYPLQKITFILTNNGNATFFWLNTWLLSTPLAGTYPHLLSHSTSPSVLVSDLASVLSLLQDVITNDAPDDRFLTHGSSFTSRCTYSLLSSDHETDFSVEHIWSSNAPIKVKIFSWLLCHDR